MRQRRTIIAITVLVIGALFWWLCGASLVERQRFYRFEKPLWMVSKPEQRYYMAKFMVDRRLLIGKSPDEVVAMLGKSEGSSAMLLYDLGPERGSMMRIDHDWLDLRLDVISGRTQVSRALIRPD